LFICLLVWQVAAAAVAAFTYAQVEQIKSLSGVGSCCPGELSLYFYVLS